mmetsp:Transcript_31847/g.62207  ORF Transcript_31847/g.62207 Transcript_31847/m.62207 type:complete len:479 (+) Transcript_31847:231-1667(+)
MALCTSLVGLRYKEVLAVLAALWFSSSSPSARRGSLLGGRFLFCRYSFLGSCFAFGFGCSFASFALGRLFGERLVLRILLTFSFEFELTCFAFLLHRGRRFGLVYFFHFIVGTEDSAQPTLQSVASVVGSLLLIQELLVRLFQIAFEVVDQLFGLRLGQLASLCHDSRETLVHLHIPELVLVLTEVVDELLEDCRRRVRQLRQAISNVSALFDDQSVGVQGLNSLLLRRVFLSCSFGSFGSFRRFLDFCEPQVLRQGLRIHVQCVETMAQLLHQTLCLLVLLDKTHQELQNKPEGVSVHVCVAAEARDDVRKDIVDRVLALAAKLVEEDLSQIRDAFVFVCQALGDVCDRFLGLVHIVQDEVDQDHQAVQAYVLVFVAQAGVHVLRPGLNQVRETVGHVPEGHHYVGSQGWISCPRQHCEQKLQVGVAELTADAHELAHRQHCRRLQLQVAVLAAVSYHIGDKSAKDAKEVGSTSLSA